MNYGNKIFKTVLIVFALIIGFIILFGLAVCCDDAGNVSQTQQEQTTKEEAVIHYEQLPAVVTSIKKKQWFATIMHRNVSVKIYNETYDIEKTIDEECNGMWLSSEFDALWNLKEDDAVVVKVYYYVLPSTGQRVSNPKISSIINFSHKELQNKSCNDIQDMLMTQRNINFNDMPTAFKRGVCCIKKEIVCDDMQENQKSEWVIDTEIPIFSQDRDYIERLI